MITMALLACTSEPPARARPEPSDPAPSTPIVTDTTTGDTAPPTATGTGDTALPPETCVASAAGTGYDGAVLWTRLRTTLAEPPYLPLDEIYTVNSSGEVEASTWVWDTAREIMLEEHVDEGFDGSEDRRKEWTLDASGYLVAYQEWTPSRSPPGRSSAYVNDADGNEIIEEYDGGGDGVADMITTTTWEAGRRQESETVDAAGAPIAHSVWEYVGPTGRSGRESNDSPVGGSPIDYLTTTSYSEPEDLLLDSITQVFGLVPYRDTYTYDTSGHMLSHRSESGFGTVTLDEWTYDAEGRLATFSQLYGGVVQTWTYDCPPRP